MSECFQVVYTKKRRWKSLRALTSGCWMRALPGSFRSITILVDDEGYVTERLRAGVMIGAFVDGRLAGFAGIHSEGSMGMLEVFEPFRRQGIGYALEIARSTGSWQKGIRRMRRFLQTMTNPWRCSKRPGLK